MTAELTDQVDRLRAALAAEHAALYAYGRLGIYLDKDIKPDAHAAEAAHRTRRDALIVQLDQAKAQPVEAETAYALPFPVTDRDTALRLAAKVEDGVAATWRSVLGSTAPSAAPSTAPSTAPSAEHSAGQPTASGSAVDTRPADPRSLAVQGFADAAARATHWRKIAGVTPLTSTFPGRPN